MQAFVQGCQGYNEPQYKAPRRPLVARAPTHRTMPAGLPSLPAALLTLLLSLGLAPAIVHADQVDYDEVGRLLRASNPAGALTRAETYLQSNPRDPQMLFLRGVALQDAGRNAEAMAAYTALTQAYPELAEPYNNLAVLQADQGRLDEALALLQQALRVRPRYAAALDNLGDVHARLALRAWREAQGFDPSLRVRNADKQARVSEALK